MNQGQAYPQCNLIQDCIAIENSLQLEAVEFKIGFLESNYILYFVASLLIFPGGVTLFINNK